MDTVAYPLPVVKRTLSFLSLTARFFGGSRVVIKRLEQFSARWKADQTITILDIGTGGADIPMAIALWARQRNWNVQITGIDVMPEITDIAKKNTQGFPEIRILNQDVRDLERDGKTFDYVIASLL